MKILHNTRKIIETEQKKCIGCNICMKGCPMLHKFCSSPKQLLNELLEDGTFDYKLPYSCMLCSYCTEVCPRDVDLKVLFLELRKNVVSLTNGKLPRELNASVIDFHQKFSFSNIFTSSITNLQSNVIFFPGCALMSYSPQIVEKVYYYLRDKIEGIGIYNKCCGNPTATMGKDEKFAQYYKIIEKEFKNKNIKKIITGCQNCFITIKENSKYIEVISLWEVLSDKGIPNNKINIGKNINYSFTIHDPCPTRNIDDIHKFVRNITNQLGLNISEMKYKGSNTLCCGAGAMVSVTQNEVAKAHKNRVANEAGTEHIITYCQQCVESMREGGKKSYHILDLIFNDDFKQLEQYNQTTGKKWLNRYKGKKIGK